MQALEIRKQEAVKRAIEVRNTLRCSSGQEEIGVLCIALVWSDDDNINSWWSKTQSLCFRALFREEALNKHEQVI